MTDKNLTNNEIIKTLEGAILNAKGCDSKVWSIEIYKLEEALDFITRQQAEIERLKSCVKSEDEVRDIAKRTMVPLVKEITREQIDIAVKYAKAEAYKECIEKVRKLAVGMHPCSDELRIFDSDLDNILKEIGVENNGNS